MVLEFVLVFLFSILAFLPAANGIKTFAIYQRPSETLAPFLFTSPRGRPSYRFPLLLSMRHNEMSSLPLPSGMSEAEAWSSLCQLWCQTPCSQRSISFV